MNNESTNSHGLNDNIIRGSRKFCQRGSNLFIVGFKFIGCRPHTDFDLDVLFTFFVRVVLRLRDDIWLKLAVVTSAT